MGNYIRYGIAIAIIASIVYGQAFNILEDADKDAPGLNFPYGRTLDNEMKLAKSLLVAPRCYHSKRNSELINSLLGLPKNMNNAGK